MKEDVKMLYVLVAEFNVFNDSDDNRGGSYTKRTQTIAVCSSMEKIEEAKKNYMDSIREFRTTYNSFDDFDVTELKLDNTTFE